MARLKPIGQHEIDRKHEMLGRAGIVITALMLLFGAAALFVSGSAFWVAVALGAGGGGLLWLALSASPKVAINVGRWFPLG